MQAEGLRTLHAKRLVHMDIKPGNIFLKTSSGLPTPFSSSPRPASHAAVSHSIGAVSQPSFEPIRSAAQSHSTGPRHHTTLSTPAGTLPAAFSASAPSSVVSAPVLHGVSVHMPTTIASSMDGEFRVPFLPGLPNSGRPRPNLAGHHPPVEPLPPMATSRPRQDLSGLRVPVECPSPLGIARPGAVVYGSASLSSIQPPPRYSGMGRGLSEEDEDEDSPLPAMEDSDGGTCMDVFDVTPPRTQVPRVH